MNSNCRVIRETSYIVKYSCIAVLKKDCMAPWVFDCSFPLLHRVGGRKSFREGIHCRILEGASHLVTSECTDEGEADVELSVFSFLLSLRREII